MSKLDRRSFNRGLGAAAFGTAILGSAARGRAEVPGGPRVIRLGVLGTAGGGCWISKAAFKAGGVEALALCDVDSEHLEKAATEAASLQGGTRPKTYKDWRQFLAHPGMEAVIIATPPHWHALPFIAAVERGLDVYLREAGRLRHPRGAGDGRGGEARAGAWCRWASSAGRARPSRTPRPTSVTGRAGRIVQVDAQINYAANPPSADAAGPTGHPRLGRVVRSRPQAALRPNVGHFDWRLEEAYGNGHLVDWGIHWIDRSASPWARACQRRYRRRAGSRC